MNTVKVSVIMSVYNGSKHLRNAIDSIISQSFRDFELIIVNDASTDKTGQILAKYTEKDRRIILVHNDINIGLTKSLNKALKLTKGEYIARMDADDIALPTRFEKQVKYLDKNPQLGLLGTRYVQIDMKGNDVKEIPVPLGRENIMKHFLLYGSAFCHSSTMFRKSYAGKVGFYDKSMQFSQDYDLGIKLSDICEVDNHPEILQKWRYNSKTGISVKKKTEQRQYSTARRKRYIENRLEGGLISYPDLIKLVRTNPDNELIVSVFFNEYDKLKKLTDEDRLSYLQLQYLHSKLKWQWLNQIADFYVHKNKKSLAFMCLCESLRLNPDQPRILKIAELLKEYSKPKHPEKLRNNEVAVSVIMTTYNRISTLYDSIQSLLNQTFQDFELVLINDGGIEDVQKIVGSFNSPKIAYSKLKTHRGRAGALNEAIAQARGKYIAYLDDDDIYYPNHLETLINFIKKNPSCDGVYSNSWWCYGKIKNGLFVEHSRKLYKLRPKKFDKNLLFKTNYISTLNILHKKKCIEKTGFFNEDFTKLEDWDMWLRLASIGTIKQLSDITGEYRWKHDNTHIVDKLTYSFLHSIIKSYYEFGLGNIAFLKSYAKNLQKRNAKNLLNKIIKGYDHQIKSAAFIKELHSFKGDFVNAQNRNFFIKIIKDYFRYDPRNCLKTIMHSKSLLMLISIFPLFPYRISKSLKGRLIKHLNTRAWLKIYEPKQLS